MKPRRRRRRPAGSWAYELRRQQLRGAAADWEVMRDCAHMRRWRPRNLRQRLLCSYGFTPFEYVEVFHEFFCE
jgi:hypothetical protein